MSFIKSLNRTKRATTAVPPAPESQRPAYTEEQRKQVSILVSEIIDFQRYIDKKAGIDISLMGDREAEPEIKPTVNLESSLVSLYSRASHFEHSGNLPSDYDSEYYHKALKIDYAFSEEEQARFPHVLKGISNLYELYPANIREVMGFLAYSVFQGRVNKEIANAALAAVVFKEFSKETNYVPSVLDYIKCNYIAGSEIINFSEKMLGNIHVREAMPDGYPEYGHAITREFLVELLHGFTASERKRPQETPANGYFLKAIDAFADKIEKKEIAVNTALISFGSIGKTMKSMKGAWLAYEPMLEMLNVNPPSGQSFFI